MDKKSEHQNIGQAEAQADLDLLDGINYTGDKGPCFGARHTMYIMMALSASLVFTTSAVFSVVIVAMTTSNTTSNADIPTYDWDNKGVLLSAVIWLQIPVQLMSGELGKRYGHKWFILGSAAANAVFFMLIPAFAVLMGSTGVIISRLLSGASLGILGPVSACIGGIWVPAEERSRNGMIGTLVMFPMAMISYVGAGQVAASSWGYPGCCYITGGAILAWCVAWYFLGHQSPATHPRITPEEKKYIETSLSTKKTKKIPTPWFQLFTSVNIWAPIIAGIGTNWIDNVMASANLIYVNKAWQIDVAKGTSTLAIGPVAGVLFAIFFANLSDYLIKNKYLRIVNARRLFHSVGVTGTTFCLLWMTWIRPGAIGWIITNGIIMNICTIVFSIGGASLNLLDIAPSFVGVVGGYAGTLSQIIVLFAPMTMDWFVKDESDPSQWRILFSITAAITISSTIFFDVFSTDKRKWDIEDDNDTTSQ